LMVKKEERKKETYFFKRSNCVRFFSQDLKGHVLFFVKILKIYIKVQNKILKNFLCRQTCF